MKVLRDAGVNRVARSSVLLRDVMAATHTMIKLIENASEDKAVYNPPD